MLQPNWNMPVNNSITQLQTFVGRMIKSKDDFTPNDVPPVGNTYVFPSNDGQKIYIKTWDANCVPHTMEYKLSGEVDLTKSSSQDSMNEILNRLTKIENQLNNQNQVKFGAGRIVGKEGDSQ